MSGELWFAEGFTSYYTDLILCRAGIISEKEYVESLSVDLNYVWNSPARNYFNPIEMSYQAPFVDAATSIDPVNRENTFISYYTYGSVLGLALDLSLRELDTDKNLDGFMRLVWEKYGKNEINYTVENLQETLRIYAGAEVSNTIFSNFIYDSKMPDYEKLFKNMGVVFEQSKLDQAYFGASIDKENGKWIINSNPEKNSAAYNANLSYGDQIISIDGKVINSTTNKNSYFTQFKPNQTVTVQFIRFGEPKETKLTFDANPTYTTSLLEKVNKKTLQKRNSWLN
jgi:predicted metalloprotease with PDZ domain